MAVAGVRSAPMAQRCVHKVCSGASAEELPGLLAQEALWLSGATGVQVYLWDPAGGFLYAAGTAGAAAGPGEPSFGHPLGQGAGFVFFRGLLPSPREKARLRQIAISSGEFSQLDQHIRTEPLTSPEEATIALVSALKAKSPVTGQHCLRVARYLAAFALALDFPEARVCQAERCGLLHDIGKLSISEAVLEKPGALEPEEWAEMKSHPQAGVRILRPCRSLAGILPAVDMHHERYDGTGYPHGVAREEIPLEARMVNICDAYDTMTSDRPYRKAMDPEEAVTRLRMGVGTQFDPDLVQVFTTQVFPALPGGIFRTSSETT